MIGEPTITVYCDGKNCDSRETFPLLAMAQGYDEPEVKSDLEEWGWTVINEYTHLCPDCTKKTKKG